VPLSAPPRLSDPPDTVSTGNSRLHTPADRNGRTEAAARPGPRAQPASLRRAATQSGLHGQPSADCVHRCCARRDGQRRGRGSRVRGTSVVVPGSKWSAAVLPSSRMRPREQMCCPGCGGRGAAAAARWFSPSWSLRVGARIAVAGQRVVNAPGIASVEPTTPCVPRTCDHPFLHLDSSGARRCRSGHDDVPGTIGTGVLIMDFRPDHPAPAKVSGVVRFACEVVVRGPTPLPRNGLERAREPDR